MARNELLSPLPLCRQSLLMALVAHLNDRIAHERDLDDEWLTVIYQKAHSPLIRPHRVNRLILYKNYRQIYRQREARS